MTEITNFELYKELHHTELKRKNQIDSLVGYPTTLLTILIGTSFYFFKSENFSHKSDDNNYITILIILSVTLFGTLIALSVFFLIKMFLNTFKKYEYLPSPITLKKRENELYEHYLNFYINNESDKVQEKAMEDTLTEFRKDLIGYYIDYGTNNQSVNDTRIKDYYIARKCLSFSIVILSILGILILNK